MRSRIRKALKWLLTGVLAVVILTGLLVAAFGVVVTRVPEYRVQVQDWINARSGLIVEFRTLRARLRFYGPELVFDDAVVRTPDRTRILATATRGSVGFDLWRALREGRLTAGRFSLQAPQIGLIRTREGRIQLLGQSALPERTDATPVALDALPTGRFDVENAVVTFRDEITGRGPWSVSGVDFELTRTEDELRLHGKASLPEALGRELAFTATADGPLERYATLVSTFSLEGEALDLAGWADVLPDEWPAPETGTGAVRINGALLGAALMQLSAEVDVQKVAAVAPAWSIRLPTAAPMQQPTVAEQPQAERQQPEAVIEPVSNVDAATAPAELPHMVSYDRIAFALRAQRRDTEWTATLKDLNLARKDASWRASEMRATWTRRTDGTFEADGSADRVVLDSVWPLLAFAPESEGLARLRALNARGAVEDISVSIERPSSGPLAYEFRAQLSDIGFEPIEKAPGLTGLSGAIEATQNGGRWRIAEHEISFDLPRWFRGPLAAHLGAGEITWRAQPDRWIVNSDQLQLQNEDGRAVARFEATIPRDGASPVLDIAAQGQDLKVNSTARYIPVGRLGARTVEWFDQAFVDGRATAADLIYRGPIRAFPFRRGEGEFLVRAHVEDAVLSYQSGWTPAERVVADVEFRNQGMHIHSTGASIGELRIVDATADIRDLKETVLSVKASARGDIGEGLRFLRESPLGPKLGAQFAKLSGAGEMTTSVRLHLPIRQMANRDIEVTTRVANATASLEGLEAPVRELAGALTVRNTLVASADLQGQWLGGPANLTITPDGRSASVLTAQGHATAERMQAVAPVPPTIGLRGAADWRATTRLTASERGESAPQIVRIESDMNGLELGLPAPLGKSEDETRNLQLTLELNGRKNALVRASYGDVRSLVRLRPSSAGWTLERGGVRADGVTPSLPDHAGLRIEGTIDRFVLDDWLALRGEGEREGRPLSEYLHAANVRVRDFEAFGFEWPDTRGVLQATQSGWRVDVSGVRAEGQILIPASLEGDQPLRATMDRLFLEKVEEQARREDGPSDPRKLPGLQVYVSDLRMGARAIGAVDLKASRTPQGIRFDSASVVSESVRAEGRGHWFVTADGQQGALDARVVSTDVAATLRALNYSGFLEAKHGEIRADITWPGGFSGNILARASGAMSVGADSGQLVNLQPGAGRVLGLFSIAALPRRLALDFSDLTEKGLAFDKIHGDFELRDGHAHTSNLLLSGPAAEIGVAGRTGLGTRDYDQTAVVTGNLGASLPVAGALAGGPAVGAALLLFSQVFKEPLKGITRGYYRITGPWDNPVVERIDAPSARAEVTSDSRPVTGPSP